MYNCHVLTCIGQETIKYIILSYLSLFGISDLPTKILELPSLFNHSLYLNIKITLSVVLRCIACMYKGPVEDSARANSNEQPSLPNEFPYLLKLLKLFHQAPLGLIFLILGLWIF